MGVQPGAPEQPTMTQIRDAEAKHLPLDQAFNEANAIRILAQELRAKKKDIAEGMEAISPGMTKRVKLNDKFWYKWSEKALDEEKQEEPDLYAARMSVLEGVSRLTETIAPKFVPVGERGEYYPPGELEKLAQGKLDEAKTFENQKEFKKKPHPWRDARQIATDMVRRVAENVKPLKEINNMSILTEVAKAIQDESKGNPIILAKHDLSPKQIGALTEAVVAEKEFEYWFIKRQKEKLGGREL